MPPLLDEDLGRVFLIPFFHSEHFAEQGNARGIGAKRIGTRRNAQPGIGEAASGSTAEYETPAGHGKRRGSEKRVV